MLSSQNHRWKFQEVFLTFLTFLSKYESRAHSIRCHYNVYKECCKENGITTMLSLEISWSKWRKKSRRERSKQRLTICLTSRQHHVSSLMKVCCRPWHNLWLAMSRYGFSHCIDVSLSFWWLEKALAIAGKDLFRNCLVVMKPKAVCNDMLSTHNVMMYIHNRFVIWLNEVKSDILVSFLKQ